MITRINNAVYKYYLTTLVFILILFKRQVPKWMQSEVKKVVVPAEILSSLGKVEKYVR